MQLDGFPHTGRERAGTLYDVVVRNELTGEMTTMRVLSNGPEAAQAEALVAQFRAGGWRKLVAFQSEVVAP